MKEKLYRIKPLEWEHPSRGIHYADAGDDSCQIFLMPDGRTFNVWMGYERIAQLADLDAAKAAAEAHYRARVEQLLEEVP